MVAVRPHPLGRGAVIPLVSSAYAADLDRRTRDELGVPEAALMENAAAGMEAALKARGYGGESLDGPITALAGKGNNGGDALAVLRRIAFRSPRGAGPGLAVILSSGEPGGLAAVQLEAARRCGATVLDWARDADACRSLLARSSVLLDGIAGTGLSGALRPREASLAEAANACGVPVAAVDVPSGSGDDIPGEAVLVRAALTLCVEPRKRCLYRPYQRAYAGDILPIPGVFPSDSGSDSSCRLLEDRDLKNLVPPFRPEEHKYDRGHCLVFAGNTGTTGAAILAARGASAGGAGLVTLYARPELWSVAASRLTGEMVKPLPEDPAGIDLGRAGAAVAGPGWGRDAAASAVLRRLWDSSLPLVLDADALALLRDLDLPKRTAATILTPHPGEASRLSGKSVEDFLSGPEKCLSEISERWGAVVVLKSCVTWIVCPDRQAAVHDGMDGFLAVGGSGDVLAGICGALLSRKLSAFDAARAAVLAHGQAGRKARAVFGVYGADALPGKAAEALGDVYAR